MQQGTMPSSGLTRGGDGEQPQFARQEEILPVILLSLGMKLRESKTIEPCTNRSQPHLN